MTAIKALLSDLYHCRSNIDFRPLWKRTVVVSASAAAISLLLLLTIGLNRSIEFEGGGIFEVPVDNDVSVADARSAISDESARVQAVTDASGQSFIRVQTLADALGSSDEIVSELAELGGVQADAVGINEVGPTWGDQITKKALRALVLFFVVVSLYLAWRLEWRMAIGALVAVVHDLLVTAGIYSLFRLEVSPATVIALLTIMGYSLYDTVVVYDKVLENELEPGSRNKGYTALVVRSMNQVLMRSINTTITTVLPVLSMLLIGGLLPGGSTIRDFAVALTIGLVLGTYSSIFLAAPMLAWLKERQPEDIAEQELKERRAARRAVGNPSESSSSSRR